MGNPFYAEPDPEQGELLIYGHRAASEWLYNHGWILSHRTLLNMVPLKNGPPMRKWGGQVVYREKDLMDWAMNRWGKEGQWDRLDPRAVPKRVKDLKKRT
jgi:hypothetical protein